MGQHAFVPTFLNKVWDGGGEGHSSSGMMCLQRQIHFVGTFLTFRSLIYATTENINLPLEASPCQLKRLFKNHFYGVFNLFNLHNLCKKTGPSFHRELNF